MDLRTQSKQRVTQPRTGILSGFTLVEVAFAVLILASSLVVLLGLQSSAVRRTLRDRDQREAMLLARGILAAIESNPEKAKLGEIDSPAAELIGQLFPNDSAISAQIKELEKFQANLKATDMEIPIPNSDPILLRQIMLNIYWGSSADESLRVVYFAPQSEN